jgi:hypothetical protein
VVLVLVLGSARALGTVNPIRVALAAASAARTGVRLFIGRTLRELRGAGLAEIK